MSKSLEQEVKDVLKSNGATFEDFCKTYNMPDFYVKLKPGYFYLEVKEKRQKYRTDLWPIDFPEKYSFILDELSGRKLATVVGASGLLVRDNNGNYHFTDTFGLLLMPKNRCKRQLQGVLKGKWVLDLRNFTKIDKIIDAFKLASSYLNISRDLVERDARIYGEFFNEEVPIAGTRRTENYRKYDLAVTR